MNRTMTSFFFIAFCFVAPLLLANPSTTASRSEKEVALRQDLIQVALAKRGADLIIRGATVLNVFTASWMADQDIVIYKDRIAWVGPRERWSETRNKW